MSIIQEALKKASSQPQISRTYAEQPPKRDAPRLSPAPRRAMPILSPAKISRTSIFYGLVFLTVFAASIVVTLIVMQVGRSMHVEHPIASESPSLQEVIVRSKAPLGEEGSDARPIVAPSDMRQAEPQRNINRVYPKFVLSGIMFPEDGPMAIVNGSVVRVGDNVSGARVDLIDRVSVVLRFEDVDIVLKLKN